VAAIRSVAKTVGERPERLLMVDYQQRTAGSRDLPPLATCSPCSRAGREPAAPPATADRSGAPDVWRRSARR
jgi:hypothetical protein